MAILKFIEEQELGDMYTWLPDPIPNNMDDYRYYANRPALNPPIRNGDVVRSRIATLTCPSDDPQTIDVEGIPVTLHNYVANYGATNHIGTSCPGVPSATCVKYFGSPLIGKDSIIGADVGGGRFKLEGPRQWKFKEIADGLSKTLLISETVQGVDGDLRGLTWWGWSAAFETFSTPNSSDPDRMQQATYCKPYEPNPPCSAATAGNVRAAARSRHPGGVNAIMCDGSVQYVVDDVDLATWRAGSSTGGEEVYDELIP
jgi:prepilin-type processing-associated H-X9-DG protein